MFNKIKQIKDLRDQAKTMQSALAEISAEGSAAHGSVKITIDGNQNVKSVEIADSLMQDRAKLQLAVRDAVNDGIKNVQKKMAHKMKEMGGLDAFKNLGL